MGKISPNREYLIREIYPQDGVSADVRMQLILFDRCFELCGWLLGRPDACLLPTPPALHPLAGLSVSFRRVLYGTPFVCVHFSFLFYGV